MLANLMDQKCGVGDLVVHNLPANLFDPTMQRWIGLGVFLFLVLWGLSKVVRAVKEWVR